MITKRRLLLVGVAASAAFALSVALAGAATRASHRAVHASATPQPPAFVGELAARLAAINGDARPASASWVQTTRQTAVSANSQDTVDSNQTVYYVVLHGNFVDKNAYLPVGASPPRGTVLTFTVDVQTQSVLDTSLSDNEPDMARVGGGAPLTIP